jgi:anti-sigma B factor antagonist
VEFVVTFETLPEKKPNSPEKAGEVLPANTPPQKSAIALMRVSGEVDLQTGPSLRTALQRITDDGHHHIVVDMTRVPYVDSFALGVMVDTQRRLKERGGDLYLAHVPPFVMRAFEITRLVRIFNVVSTVDEAIQLVSEQ